MVSVRSEKIGGFLLEMEGGTRKRNLRNENRFRSDSHAGVIVVQIGGARCRGTERAPDSIRDPRAGLETLRGGLSHRHQQVVPTQDTGGPGTRRRVAAVDHIVSRKQSELAFQADQSHLSTDHSILGRDWSAGEGGRTPRRLFYAVARQWCFQRLAQRCETLERQAAAHGHANLQLRAEGMAGKGVFHARGGDPSGGSPAVDPIVRGETELRIVSIRAGCLAAAPVRFPPSVCFRSGSSEGRRGSGAVGPRIRSGGCQERTVPEFATGMEVAVGELKPIDSSIHY
mmetsp:Transcript_150/g.300  ORF Transcript_150/g.300 Transcript_150/m.300 type:complete len:285 (-) Transcript_150:86-940(-)